MRLNERKLTQVSPKHKLNVEINGNPVKTMFFFQKDVDLLLKSNLNWNANADKDARSF